MTIEERAKAKYPTAYDIDTPAEVRAEKDAYIAGAKEQLEIDIERAVEWLDEHTEWDSTFANEKLCKEKSAQYLFRKFMKGGILSQKIDDKSLSIRCIRCLESADIITFGDLVKYKRLDLLKFRNFGHKSLNELDDLLSRNGLEWKGEEK